MKSWKVGGIERDYVSELIDDAFEELIEYMNENNKTKFFNFSIVVVLNLLMLKLGK